jgi:hypothetical protein
MPRLTIAALTVLLLAPACDDAVSGGFPAGDSAGEDDATGYKQDEILPTSLVECELPAPCEHPFVGQDLNAADGSASLSASDQCIFTTLARGEPALVETIAEFPDAMARLDYAIAGDGIALRQASGESAAGGRWQNAVFVCELQPSDFFTDCLKTASEACLDPEQWVVGCQPLDNLVCPE